MKNTRITLLGLLIWTIFGCIKEKPPPIDFTPILAGLIDTSFITGSPDPVQSKVVLLEESTGVRCLNCPKGHREGSALSAKYPGQVALVYLHTGFLARPYDDPPVVNKYDFRIPEATEILNLLGGSGVQPIGAVDRKIHPGETTILIEPVNTWAVPVDSQVVLIPLVNLSIETRIEGQYLISKVTLQFNENLSGDTSALISLFVTESGIVDYQLDVTFKDPNYVHDHVLRAMMGSSGGNVIPHSKVIGRVVIKEYSQLIKSEWILDNVNVVAGVHRDGSVSKEVLQAAESVVQ